MPRRILILTFVCIAGMMLGLGVTSLLLSIFDLKHYAHVQLKPHISRDHQVRSLHSFAHTHVSV